MSKPIVILGQAIEPGKRTQINMDIARLHTNTKLEVPIIIERAKKDGPCLLLLAGIHGDEVNGIEIVRQIITKGINKPEIGMVICVPVLNVFGFLNQTREFPDGRDLNRVFPGSKKGSLAGRYAYYFMDQIMPHVDYAIDYHTGGAGRFNYTQTRVDPSDQEGIGLANVFGARFVMHAPQREKSFRASTVKLGKKVILFEGGKSLYLDKNVTNIGVQGAMRVMNHLKMRDFSKELSSLPMEVSALVIKETKWVRAKYSGMYRSFIAAGSKVKKGEVLGSITDPYGSFERNILAPYDGYIICSNHSPVVNQGDAIIHLGKSS